jgi:hypothetical protein
MGCAVCIAADDLLAMKNGAGRIVVATQIPIAQTRGRWQPSIGRQRGHSDMRLLSSISLALMLGGTAITFTNTAAEAQRYRVVCVAPGNSACRTACGSNTHTVVCSAQMRNGRCVRYCGPPR